ncbi:hypothetical protein N431DRAFT_535809, partial [Stipitochalara longipes BDJ]
TFLVLHPVCVVNRLKRFQPILNYTLRNLHGIYLTHLDLQLNPHGCDRVRHALQMFSLAFGSIEYHVELLGGTIDKALELLLQELLKLRQPELAISFIVLLVIGQCNRKLVEVVEKEQISFLCGFRSLLLPLPGSIVFLSPVVDAGDIVDGMCGHGDFGGGERPPVALVFSG